jgi:hypothetical protein
MIDVRPFFEDTPEREIVEAAEDAVTGRTNQSVTWATHYDLTAV